MTSGAAGDDGDVDGSSRYLAVRAAVDEDGYAEPFQPLKLVQRVGPDLLGTYADRYPNRDEAADFAGLVRPAGEAERTGGPGGPEGESERELHRGNCGWVGQPGAQARLHAADRVPSVHDADGSRERVVDGQRVSAAERQVGFFDRVKCGDLGQRRYDILVGGRPRGFGSFDGRTFRHAGRRGSVHTRRRGSLRGACGAPRCRPAGKVFFRIEQARTRRRRAGS